jgi:FKBP-type peptidyl-prolyl cis-trans isomerase FkpA
MSVTAVPIAPTSRRVLAMLWGGLLVVLIAAVALAVLGTGRAVAQAGTNEQFLEWNGRQSGVQTTASGLQYKVLEAGEGGKPTDADVALVSYKGSLRDGTVFDQNERTPMPVSQVVPGFSEGLKQMQKGGKYRLWIKPELGYGARAAGPIPPNSLLVFDVELIEFLPMAVLQQMQMQQMMQGGAAPAAPGR